jgi:hypothetical protein
MAGSLTRPFFMSRSVQFERRSKFVLRQAQSAGVEPKIVVRVAKRALDSHPRVLGLLREVTLRTLSRDTELAVDVSDSRVI